MSFNPGGGGKISTASDVAMNNPADGQVLKFNGSLTLWQNGTATGGSGTTVPKNTQTVNYTLVLSDAGSCVELNSASAITLTIPTNASVAFPVDTVLEIYQMGLGQVTIAPASGVVIRTPASLTTRAQYSTLTLRQRATNEWVLSGDLT
jgi:hypothetical protein